MLKIDRTRTSVPEIIQSLKGYLDGQRRVTHWPAKGKADKRKLVLTYLASKLEPGANYSERQINEILKEWHTFNDWALLRRELCDQGFLNRTPDGSKYWIEIQIDPSGTT